MKCPNSLKTRGVFYKFSSSATPNMAIKPSLKIQTTPFEFRLPSIDACFLLHPVSPPVAICTRSEMEDFLREAACMKEFDHTNVMRLLGKFSSYCLLSSCQDCNNNLVNTMSVALLIRILLRPWSQT